VRRGEIGTQHKHPDAARRRRTLKESPSIVLARAEILVVFPVPGGPARMMLGRFPSLAMTRSRPTVCSLPTTSSRTRGRYFSTQGREAWESPPEEGGSPISRRGEAPGRSAGI
jgi:hypothetical protein